MISIKVNSLWPSDTIWWHRSGSTLAQVLACCLTAPSHYLNQCWLIISKASWHSSVLSQDVKISVSKTRWKIAFLKSTRSPRDQWVKYHKTHCGHMYTLGNKLQWNLKLKYKLFFHLKIICKISQIFKCIFSHANYRILIKISLIHRSMFLGVHSIKIHHCFR